MSLIRFLSLVPLVWILKILAMLLSPILALISLFVEKDKHVDKLPGFLALFHTHDASLDELWNSEFGANYVQHYNVFRDKSLADFQNSKWLRFLARMFWIVRNPAYGFADKAGFSTSGLYILKKYSKGVWDTDSTNWELTVVKNASNKTAFSLRAQIFFYKNRYIRINMGWKITMPSRAMIAVHINPFRSWK